MLIFAQTTQEQPQREITVTAITSKIENKETFPYEGTQQVCPPSTADSTQPAR